MVSNIVPAGKIAGKLSDHYDGPHDQRPGRHGDKVFPELRLDVVTVLVLVFLAGSLFDPAHAIATISAGKNENTPMFRITPQIAVTTIPMMICQRFDFVIVVWF